VLATHLLATASRSSDTCSHAIAQSVRVASSLLHVASASESTQPTSSQHRAAARATAVTRVRRTLHAPLYFNLQCRQSQRLCFRFLLRFVALIHPLQPCRCGERALSRKFDGRVIVGAVICSIQRGSRSENPWRLSSSSAPTQGHNTGAAPPATDDALRHQHHCCQTKDACLPRVLRADAIRIDYRYRTVFAKYSEKAICENAAG